MQYRESLAAKRWPFLLVSTTAGMLLFAWTSHLSAKDVGQRAVAPTRTTADAILIHRDNTQWSRYLHAWLRLPDWVDLGLEQRTRFESFDHPFRVGEFGTNTQLPLRSRLQLGLNFKDLHVLFEAQDSRTHFNDTGDFTTTAVINRTDILQLFAVVTFRHIAGTRLRTDLHVGRVTMDLGSRRYIARNKFRNTTNAFDGVHWQLGHANMWRLRAFVVEPVLRRAVRLDTQSARTLLWGVYGEHAAIPGMKGVQIDIYYFGLNDQRSATISTQRTLSTFGLRVVKPPKIGELDYEFEGAIQTGRRGQTDHFAYNPHAHIGFTFPLPWHPRLLVQYDYASGTRTPNGSQDQTFDRLFGARRFELAPSGIFGPFQRSNISSPGWRVIVHPTRAWTVQLKHRVWFLAQARDAFAGTGLQDPTGGSGNFLGHDLEMRIQWTANDNLQFEAGYDHWFKGRYFDRLPPSAGLPSGGEMDTDYFYFLTTMRI